MLTAKISELLNNQIKLECFSSQLYLSMAVWSENKGMPGVAEFMYNHAEEERSHMLKIIRFVNERGGEAIISGISKPESEFESLKNMFETVYDHEVMISKKINEIIDLAIQEKDHASNNFLQWYVSEQIEEETLAKLILDKVYMIGEDKGGLYLFDKDITTLSTSNTKVVGG